MKVALIHLKGAHTDRTVLMESTGTATRKAKDAPMESIASTGRAALMESTAAIPAKARHAPMESVASTDRDAAIRAKVAPTDRTVRTESTVPETADSTVQHALREDVLSLAVNLDSRRTSIQPLRRRASTE